jgi:hypothetical protein
LILRTKFNHRPILGNKQARGVFQALFGSGLTIAGLSVSNFETVNVKIILMSETETA